MTKQLRPAHCSARPLWIFPVLIFLVLGSTQAPPLEAQTSHETHEVHLHPGAETIRLRLPGQPQASSGLVEITTLSPPSFGRLQGTTYVPDDEFWEVGADRLTLRLESGSSTETHTFLLSILKVIEESVFAVETFETPSSWATEGAAGVLSVVRSDRLENYSLEAIVADDGATAWISSPTFTPEPPVQGGGVTGLGGAGGTMIEPPPLGRSAGPAELVIASLGELQIQVGVVTNGYGQDVYRMRVTAPTDLCDVCETPWREVPISLPIDFRLWAGVTSFGAEADPYTLPWSIRFDLRPKGGPFYTDWLEGDFYQESIFIKAGIMESTGDMAGAKIYYDNLEVWKENSEFNRKNHRAQTFEQGELGDWESRGSAGALSQSAISGDWGWRVDASAIAASGEDAILVDTGPGEQQQPAGTVTRGAALFRVDLSDLELPVGDSVQLLRASSSDAIDGGIHLSLLLQRSAAGLRVRVRARDDQQVTQAATWYPLSGNGPFDMAVRWQAATGPGQNNGQARLWVDGLPAGSRSDLDNDTKVLEAFAFGSHRSTLDGSGFPGHGVFYIDDLATFPEPQ